MTNRVFRAAAVAICAVALLPAAAGADDEAAALLAKHTAYVAWSAGDGRVSTLREAGHVVRDDGTTVAQTTVLWYGEAFRSTTWGSAQWSGDHGFTGRVVWATGTNGFTVQPAGEVVKALFDQYALLGEKTASFAGSVERHERVGGVDTAVVRLTSAVGLPMEVWIDQTSGAYKRAAIDPGGKYETRYDDIAYTEAAGKRFISGWRYGGTKYARRFETIESNAAVSPNALHPPKQTAAWTFGDAAASVDLTEYNIILDATVNGVKGRFLFDTGAGGTLLRPSFVQRVGAKHVDSTRIVGIGGGEAGEILHVDSIAIGGSTLSNVRVFSNAGLENTYFQRERIDGLLGFDILAAAVVDLNLDTKTLRIMDPAKVAPSGEGGVPLRVDLSDLHIRVPMQVDGKAEVLATLDSGNPVNVLFSKNLIFQNNVTFTPNANFLGMYRRMSGVAGSEIEECGYIDSLALGPIRYHPVPACESGSMARNEVLVGLEFMRNFNYVFDYPDGLVVLHPRK